VRVSELEVHRDPIESDRIDLTVMLAHERPDAGHVTIASAPQDRRATVPQHSGEVLILTAEVYDETAVHMNLGWAGPRIPSRSLHLRRLPQSEAFLEDPC